MDMATFLAHEQIKCDNSFSFDPQKKQKGWSAIFFPDENNLTSTQWFNSTKQCHHQHLQDAETKASSPISYSRSTNSPSMSIVKKIGDTGSTLALHHCTCVLGSSFRGPQSTGAREADTPTSAWHPLRLSRTCSSHTWSRVKPSRSRRRNRMPA